MMRARTAATVCAVIAFVSSALTLPDTWTWLSQQRSEFDDLTPTDRLQAAGFNGRLPVGGFDFFRANVYRGDSIYVHARPGASVLGVDFPTAARLFARYYLLPAIVVDDPRRATVVVAVGRDPSELGLKYKAVIRADGGAFVVARIRDPA